jgi:uncharacterized cysteine cluster protein YcgN (CxxCxxCC family)
MTKKALLDACAIFGMPIKDTLFTDDFLLALCDDCGDEVLINVLEEQSRNLKKTSISSLQILDKLRINRCNKFADRLYRTISDRS